LVASAARELLDRCENERSGVLSTAMSLLGLYRDPVVTKVTARCDWRIADLVSVDLPATLYLVAPSSDISRTKLLVRLILNQIGRRLTRHPTIKRSVNACCSCLTSSPGRPDFFGSALALLAGYGLEAFPIACSRDQMDKAIR
jgi:type IV secretion system protein VirD4